MYCLLRTRTCVGFGANFDSKFEFEQDIGTIIDGVPGNDRCRVTGIDKAKVEGISPNHSYILRTSRLSRLREVSG